MHQKLGAFSRFGMFTSIHMYGVIYNQSLLQYISSDLRAAYYDLFASLPQILCNPCNTNESSGSRHLPPPTVPQEPKPDIPIRRPLPPVPPSHLYPIRSIRTIQKSARQFILQYTM